MRVAILVLLLSLISGAFAAEGNKIYKWVLPDGSITYSDKPQEKGAKEVELPPLQIYSAPRLSSPPADKAKEDDKKAVGYDSVKVVSPTPNETVRDNGGSVSVRIEVKPALQQGHTIEILVDGKPIGAGASTSASVNNLDRGSHTVSAVVKDESGKAVANASGVTFHLKRASKKL